jgi:hypothetical protein
MAVPSSAPREGETTVIKFRCPNGHPLASPDSRVGKSGQCPRCQAQFVVPAPETQLADDVTQIRSADAESAQKSLATGPTPDTEKFMFLCPNGHKLVGSSSMRGRPGQCPHCNSRFLIPDPNAETADDADPAEPLAGFGDIAVHAADADEIVWDTLAEDGTFPGDATPSRSTDERDEPPPPPVPVSCHPLAHIIRRIWTHLRTADPLELRLKDGCTLIVESFSAELSQHEYGVFAVRGDENTTNVVVLPWDQITRVTLTRVASLPADLGRP